jgi:hypothetical protein
MRSDPTKRDDDSPLRFDPRAGVTQPRKDGATRRRSGRLPQEMVMSNIGPVLDISSGGMRAVCREKPPQRTNLTLEGFTLPGALQAELAWTKRVGVFKHEAGYRFVNVSPEMMRCLTEIAGINRNRRAI